MLPKESLEEYFRLGFLVVPSVLSADEVDECMNGNRKDGNLDCCCAPPPTNLAGIGHGREASRAPLTGRVVQPGLVLLPHYRRK